MKKVFLSAFVLLMTIAAISCSKKEEKIPQWAKEFIDSNIFSSEEQWQQFFEEFEACHDNILKELQTAYPRLTSTDLQVMALYMLGMDNADVCLLLGLTQRTIWSRRMRIKNRIGLAEKENIDKWLEEFVLSRK